MSLVFRRTIQSDIWRRHGVGTIVREKNGIIPSEGPGVAGGVCHKMLGFGD